MSKLWKGISFILIYESIPLVALKLIFVTVVAAGRTISHEINVLEKDELPKFEISNEYFPSLSVKAF